VLGEEQLVRHDDGTELPIIANVAPVLDPDGQLAAVTMVFQDISSIREMDRLKDEFLAITGHELRTPVAGIRGIAQLLQRRGRQLDGDAVAGALAALTDQADYMARLVDELLDVSRLRTNRLPMEIASVDIAPILHAAVRAIQPQREIRVEASPPIQVLGDADRLLQVFTNLLDNAVKYSQPGTPVDLEAHARNGEARITVRDRGIGVPAEARQHLFERFYRAENASLQAGGLGLGLYLCREIIERHNGTIELSSEVGEGSAFSVTLPLAAELGEV
jgi:signal transduction histidine kinase